MTDLKSLLKPDQGQPAIALQLVDKKGFEAWLKAQPAQVRHAARGAGLQGRGLPARHPARRARRMVGGARRRQCRGAQPLVPRQGGGEPARGHLPGRRARPRPRDARLAARPVSVRPLPQGEEGRRPARPADRRAGADRRDRADRRIDLPGPRPRQHAGRRSRPGRAQAAAEALAEDHGAKVSSPRARRSTKAIRWSPRSAPPPRRAASRG